MLESITASIKKELCPYCFETFQMSETPFRCVNTPPKCELEADPVLVTKWEESLPVGKVVTSKRYSRAVRCACGQETGKRLCPLCHMELPRMIGETKNLVFALIGAKESGKSHYIAVLIDRLRKRVGPDLDLLLEPVNDRTINRYNKDFYDPLFKKNTRIVATQKSVAKKQVPLIYTLLFRGRSITGKAIIKNTVSIVFFDTAGEDLDSSDVLSTVNKYIYRADGLILLLDPLQLGEVRADLTGKVPLPDQNSETSDIVSRVSELNRSARGLTNEMLDTPLAVAFSKMDTVTSLIDPQFQLNSTGNHSRGFDLDDFNAVNAEMRALVSRWQGDGLLNQVSTMYRRHGFFGLSALGCSPDARNQVARISPHRVEDPFLWMLYQHGLLKAARRK